MYCSGLQIRYLNFGSCLDGNLNGFLIEFCRSKLGMATGPNPLGLPIPNPNSSTKNLPVKKLATRHGHDFSPKPVPARVSGDPRVACAREHHRGCGVARAAGGRARGQASERAAGRAGELAQGRVRGGGACVAWRAGEHAAHARRRGQAGELVEPGGWASVRPPGRARARRGTRSHSWRARTRRVRGGVDRRASSRSLTGGRARGHPGELARGGRQRG